MARARRARGQAVERPAVPRHVVECTVSDWVTEDEVEALMASDWPRSHTTNAPRWSAVGALAWSRYSEARRTWAGEHGVSVRDLRGLPIAEPRPIDDRSRPRGGRPR